MKIKTELLELKNILKLFQSTLPDKSSSTNTPALALFQIDDTISDKVIVRGSNTYIRVKTLLNCTYSLDEDESTIFGIEYDNLLSLINTFSVYENVDGSPIEVNFDVDKDGVVKLSIDYTYSIDLQGIEKVIQDSIFKTYKSITNRQISLRQLDDLSILTEGDVHKVEINQLLQYLNWFLPRTNKVETIDQNVDKLFFQDDLVSVRDAFIFSYAHNFFRDVFNNIILTHSALNLFNLVCNELLKREQSTLDIILVKDEPIITIGYDDTYFSVVYLESKNNTLPEYLKPTPITNSFLVPRDVFLTTIRRCEIESSDIVVSLKDDKLQFIAKDFTQEIPVLNNNVEPFIVRAVAKTLSQAILGASCNELLEFQVTINDKKVLLSIHSPSGWVSTMIMNLRVGALF